MFAMQVLVKVHCAGINPVDTYIRSGTHNIKPTLPYIPGSDGAGVIEEAESDSRFKVSLSLSIALLVLSNVR